MLLTSDFSPTLFFSFELWALCLCFYRKLLFWNALQQLCFSKPGKLNPDIQRFWQKQPTCTYSARTICEILSFWSMWRIKANSTFWITKIMIHHHKRIIFFAISWPSGTHPDLISLIMKKTLLAGTVPRVLVYLVTSSFTAEYKLICNVSAINNQSHWVKHDNLSAGFCSWL